MLRNRRYLVFAAALLCALLCAQAASADTVSYSDRVQADRSVSYVNFGATQVTDLQRLEAFLDELPNLAEVEMYETSMSAAWAKELSERYPNVRFGWTFRIPCTKNGADFTHVVRTDATSFSTMHNNRSPVHTSADFEVLRYCTRLMAVDIGHNNVEDLSFLTALPHLRVLIIGRNNSLSDISPLAACTELEYLEAFSCKIQSVAPLLNCPHLMDLNIPNNRVQDPELFAQMTSLKRLWAFNYAWNSMETSYVDSSMMAMIRNALPGCQVNFNQAGTGGDWRYYGGDSNGTKVPHYEVITSMFVNGGGSYVPFADSQPLVQ